MTYATIMVQAEPSPEGEPRLHLAADIANRFGASLIGIGVEVLYPIVMGGFGEVMVEAGEEAIEADLKAAKTAFRKISASVVKGTEWRSQRAFPESMIARNARAADLVVAAPSHGPDVGVFSRADPGELLMTCGRPILVAAPEVSSLDASSIVIGWKDTRETRRAVADALPFLRRARQILIVEVCEGRDEAAAQQNVADVAAWLGRHGISASMAVRPRSDESVADQLRYVAEVQEADLLVVGGYGHSRLKEWIFGGVTRAFLARPPGAVLLSR